jgi:ELMO domain-containing protein
MLRHKVRIKYDVQNPLNREELLQLWKLSFDTSPQVISEDWVKIGFQGPDPSTDFRGGGLYSLTQLVYFATNYPEKYESYKQAEYSFAISSINLTYFYFYYFQLLPRKALGTSDCRRAPPAVMKVFARLNIEDQNTLNEIHSMSSIKMHENWSKMRESSAVTVMDFMKALVSATYTIENALLAKPKTLLDFKRSL